MQTMKSVSNSMSPVAKCDATGCTYNKNQACHAKAITVGHGKGPGCDTFFQGGQHTHESRRIAGVGACKMSECRFNQDFECAAHEITVGYVGSEIRCMTYHPQQASQSA